MSTRWRVRLASYATRQARRRQLVESRQTGRLGSGRLLVPAETLCKAASARSHFRRASVPRCTGTGCSVKCVHWNVGPALVLNCLNGAQLHGRALLRQSSGPAGSAPRWLLPGGAAGALPLALTVTAPGVAGIPFKLHTRVPSGARLGCWTIPAVRKVPHVGELQLCPRIAELHEQFHSGTEGGHSPRLRGGATGDPKLHLKIAAIVGGNATATEPSRHGNGLECGAPKVRLLLLPARITVLSPGLFVVAGSDRTCSP